jgi:hypothetical protein
VPNERRGNGGLENIIRLLNSCTNYVRLYLLEILSCVGASERG